MQHPITHHTVDVVVGLGPTLAPHGVCWFWNPWLIALHAPADLATFLAYSAISLLALYVYRHGGLSQLRVAFPRLWVLGALFVGSCGLSHLGNYLEIFYGGRLYWWTGANKVFMAVVSVWFAADLWRTRERLVLVGLLLRESAKQLDAAGVGDRVAGNGAPPPP